MLIAFFSSPVGLVISIAVAAALLVRFFWDAVRILLELALIVAIVGCIIGGLGGFSGHDLFDHDRAPPRQVHFRGERI